MDGRSRSCPCVVLSSRRESLRPICRMRSSTTAFSPHASGAPQSEPSSPHQRAIFEYVSLMATTFGTDLGLLLRNLTVIPKACFYARLVRRAGCSHIHAHWATVSTSAAMLISRMSGVPFSFTGHAWDIFCDTRLLAEKADAARFVLTCTAYNRQHLMETAAIDRNKVHVVYHGLRLPPRVANTRGSFDASARAPDGRALEREEGVPRSHRGARDRSRTGRRRSGFGSSPATARRSTSAACVRPLPPGA